MRNRLATAFLLTVFGGTDAELAAQSATLPANMVRDLEALQTELREEKGSGEWPVLPSGTALSPGDREPRVAILRERLLRSRDLSGAGPADPDLYDPALESAVRRFQSRHGLVVDGVVGTATTSALNVSLEHRLAQVEVNLGRWRAMPENLGERYFLVNAADFSVELGEDGARVGRYRAIVGRRDRPTPVFTADLTYIALAPFWEVPPGIARNDVLPRIKADPTYLASHNMRVFDVATGSPVDPASVDWSEMEPSEVNGRFRFREDPGPQNPLGAVKFIFPNGHNVYMHDTPTRELFDRPVRTFSSGCIRVESALDLAVHLLESVPGWPRERVEEVVALGAERRVDLPARYRVYVRYFTAWVDDAGLPQFRDDIYGRDAVGPSSEATRTEPAATTADLSAMPGGSTCAD